MPTDALGLPLTAATPEALAAWDRAVEGMLEWNGQVVDLFRAAAAEDPRLGPGHAGAAVGLFLEERFDEARAAVAEARAVVDGASPRERSLVEGLTLLVEGRAADAERVMRAHLAEWPRDVLVAQRLYFLWFWQGRFPDMLDLTTALLPATGDNAFLQGMHAFVLEEAGRCDEALRTAETAIARNPRDAWGVHAFAHALYESNASEAGIHRLPPAIAPCRQLGWFRNHLFWHLALMHFARGDYARASALMHEHFERAPSAIAGDLHDSISLLWRLGLAGHDVGDRWAPFTAIARQRLSRLGLLFHVCHVTMALVGGGDWATAERQLDLLRGRVARDRTGLLGDLVIPLVEGLGAFAAGDYRRTIERIEPLRPRLIQLGGSRAQRDVFHDTFLEACLRAGDGVRAERYLSERIARRPDHYWLSRRAA